MEFVDFSLCANALRSKWQIPCHTERSEVSINSKRILNSLDFLLTLNMTIWIFRSFHSLKMTKPSSYWAFARKRSIHKFKVWIYTFKAWNFYLKFKVYLNILMDFSLCANALRSKWQKGHKSPKTKHLKILKKQNVLKNAFCKQKDEKKLRWNE